MKTSVFCSMVVLLILSSCKQTTKDQWSTDTAEQKMLETLYTVEDTVRHQIGGQLFYLTIGPSDSITVINAFHDQAEDGTLYREYHFIVHNRHSVAHKQFTSLTLDSVYNSYRTDKEYCRLYETLFKPRLDSIKSRSIDPSIKQFNGYWVYLKEYNGGYFLDDDWSWHGSFCISDSILTHHFMDGPEPGKIIEAHPVGGNGISLLVDNREIDNRNIKIEPVDKSRSIYRFTGRQGTRYIAPATAIHNFEIIQYTNNTGDLI